MGNKQTEELSYFSSKAVFRTILRMENIGQIYHEHKIRKILNCDMTKVLEQDFLEKHPNLYKELLLIPNLRFQMKL